MRLEPMPNEDMDLHDEVIPITLANKGELQRAYMPFLKDGGLFLATKEEYQLDDEIFLLLRIMDDPEKYPVVGKVVWLTPKGAQGAIPMGIGIQFTGNDGQLVKNKIETYLPDALHSDWKTDTI